MKVSEIMTRDVASVDASEPASVATQMMWNRDCGAIPVQEKERVVGMITDRDICMSTWMQNRPPGALRVSEVMSKALYYCSPSDSVSSAEGVMRSRQIRRLPVLDEQRRLVGILSLADIARSGDVGNVRNGSPEVAAGQVALTLASICQPPPGAQAPAADSRRDRRVG
jgi:CBS domain-containing protein